MANPEHMEQLKWGVDNWNKWKGKKRGIRPDLRGADLRGADLSEANMREADLRGASLREVDLRGAYLMRADLREANLYGASLREANLSGAYLYEADLSGTDLIGAKLRYTHLMRADLSRTDLREASLRGAQISEANLHNANLGGASLVEATLNGASLVEAVLNRADLHGASLNRADLNRADLYEASLREANLSGANLYKANLRRTDLSGAILNEASLSYASLGETLLALIDLRTTKGLATIYHAGRSPIELFSIQLPQDGSAIHFLRGTGVPDEWIDLWRTTTMHPIQYHSCFISYSSKDEMLARRLHADLQAEGVRCWFAPEDMKIGDRIRQRIDEAIHLQDKLLLLLSKHSIASDWVADEVEAAIEKEAQQKRDVLFPIRLDASVMHTSQAWAAKLRRSRHIGDFTKWETALDYQTAFKRLLRNLKQD